MLCAALAASIAVMVGCGQVDDVTVTKTAVATIPEGTLLEELLGELDFLGFDGFDVTRSRVFQDSGYSKEDVASVHLESMVLTITDPEDATFDFLERIVFHADAEGVPVVEIARLTQVPGGQSRLDLVVRSDVELEPYVLAPEMVITAAASGVRPPQETTVEAKAAFAVEVNIPEILR